MQGLSKSGVHLQSVLSQLEFYFDFNRCIEGSLAVLRLSRVLGNLP